MPAQQWRIVVLGRAALGVAGIVPIWVLLVSIPIPIPILAEAQLAISFGPASHHTNAPRFLWYLLKLDKFYPTIGIGIGIIGMGI